MHFYASIRDFGVQFMVGVLTPYKIECCSQNWGVIHAIIPWPHLITPLAVFARAVLRCSGNQSIKNESPTCKAATQSMFARCCVCEDFLVPYLSPTHKHTCPLFMYVPRPVSQLNVFSFWMSPLLYLPFPPNAEQWLWLFLLNAPHVLHLLQHCSLSAWYSFKGPKSLH